MVDLVAYDDASIIDDLYLDKLRAGSSAAGSPAALRRYRLPLDGGTARREELFDEPLELPRIAYRARNGRDYRYVYGVGAAGRRLFDQLVKVDVRERHGRALARGGLLSRASRCSSRRRAPSGGRRRGALGGARRRGASARSCWCSTQAT